MTITLPRVELPTLCVAIDPHRVKIRQIKVAVCKRFNISEEQLMSECRKRKFAAPRQLAMTISRELTRHSWPAIARYYRRGDHTTAIHAQRATRERLASDPTWVEHYQAIKFAVSVPAAANDQAAQ